jgi:hypothetical protein
MSGWGCPHEITGKCLRVLGRDCDPGMKGCVLFGRFVFSNPEKNRPARTHRSGTDIAAQHPPDKDESRR